MCDECPFDNWWYEYVRENDIKEVGGEEHWKVKTAIKESALALKGEVEKGYLKK